MGPSVVSESAPMKGGRSSASLLSRLPRTLVELQADAAIPAFWRDEQASC